MEESVVFVTPLVLINEENASLQENMMYNSKTLLACTI